MHLTVVRRVSLKGTLTFRYDYRLGTRREAITLGQYNEFRESGAFQFLAEIWLRNAGLPDSTAVMRKNIFGKRKLDRAGDRYAVIQHDGLDVNQCASTACRA